MTQHPITPPPELAARWVNEIYGDDGFGFDVPLHPITLRLVERAAQWGADQELEACCAFAQDQTWGLVNGARVADVIRAARRPKPSSLKEQGLDSLQIIMKGYYGDPAHADLIRRALEQLPDNE